MTVADLLDKKARGIFKTYRGRNCGMDAFTETV